MITPDARIAELAEADADELQAVYDLLIVLCEHDPKWRARGAAALRTIGKLAAEHAAMKAALEQIRGYSETNGMTRRRMKEIAARALIGTPANEGEG